MDEIDELFNSRALNCSHNQISYQEAAQADEKCPMTFIELEKIMIRSGQMGWSRGLRMKPVSISYDYEIFFSITKYCARADIKYQGISE